jgi:hypothetical protein
MHDRLPETTLSVIFRYFDTKDVDALADRMAGEMVRRVPPASVGDEGRKAEAKQQRTQDVLMQEVHDFARRETLNVYKKARLANRFKWALLEAGYPKEFADRLTYELATAVSTATSGSE